MVFKIKREGSLQNHSPDLQTFNIYSIRDRNCEKFTPVLSLYDFTPLIGQSDLLQDWLKFVSSPLITGQLCSVFLLLSVGLHHPLSKPLHLDLELPHSRRCRPRALFTRESQATLQQNIRCQDQGPHRCSRDW